MLHLLDMIGIQVYGKALPLWVVAIYGPDPETGQQGRSSTEDPIAHPRLSPEGVWVHPTPVVTGTGYLFSQDP